MIFRWFESLIDIFREVPDRTPPKSVVRFYAHYLRQVWKIFVAALVVGLAVALIEVAMFDFLGRLVDMAQKTPAATFFQTHAGTLAWMAFVVVVLRPLSIGIHDLLVNQTLNPGMTSMMRWQHHRYVLKQSLSFFQNDFAGRIANRIMQTAPSLRQSAVQVVDALWYVTVYAGTSIYLFAKADIWLAVPLIWWIAGYIGMLVFFVPRVKERSWKASEARSKLMGRIVDGYSNVMTLKLFAHTNREEAYAREAIVEQTEKVRSSSRMVTTMDVSITTLNGLLIGFTSALALWLWSRGTVTTGQVALAVGLVIRINNMSGWIMWVVNGIFEDVGTVQDGITTLSQERTVVDRADAVPLVVSKGEVRFDDIHFHYGKAGGIIGGLDLVVRAGEKIGLVGPSGAGKSTMVNVLLRLYDLEDGHIYIDGQDVAKVTQESLRSKIGVVTQDTSLLHRSIRDNLLYGRPDATDAEMAEAVRQARADEFIPLLSDGEGRTGYDAHAGERGVKLSGGQRQRIAIARVLLKDAPILVLDEATSAPDSEAEAAIQESLETLMRGKTVIAIAHRLSTIAKMDRLVVMEHGAIVETGTHSELIARGGLYARLWAHQTGGFVGVE
ncbi:ABC transporter ATP-binding protein [Luteibacter sp. 9133]|uniref:ABC transporter ATP-binding protein n=1 Tax=Luteibacter sp. 9133 TaxID=1500891 RepID=UPI0005B98E28|nr:ABC transporter ATP-binding protein [Luteibacter sp. 9133]